MRPVDTDVICLHTRDGKVIPIRFRVLDEDGLFQAYTIKEYRDLSGQGARTMPDGVYVADNTFVYECMISIFNRMRMIRLYYNPRSMVWKMTG